MKGISGHKVIYVALLLQCKTKEAIVLAKHILADGVQLFITVFISINLDYKTRPICLEGCYDITKALMTYLVI